MSRLQFLHLTVIEFSSLTLSYTHRQNIMKYDLYKWLPLQLLYSCHYRLIKELSGDHRCRSNHLKSQTLRLIFFLASAEELTFPYRSWIDSISLRKIFPLSPAVISKFHILSFNAVFDGKLNAPDKKKKDSDSWWIDFNMSTGQELFCALRF